MIAFISGTFGIVQHALHTNTHTYTQAQAHEVTVLKMWWQNQNHYYVCNNQIDQAIV